MEFLDWLLMTRGSLSQTSHPSKRNATLLLDAGHVRPSDGSLTGTPSHTSLSRHQWCSKGSQQKEGKWKVTHVGTHKAAPKMRRTGSLGSLSPGILWDLWDLRRGGWWPEKTRTLLKGICSAQQPLGGLCNLSTSEFSKLISWQCIKQSFLLWGSPVSSTEPLISSVSPVGLCSHGAPMLINLPFPTYSNLTSFQGHVFQTHFSLPSDPLLGTPLTHSPHHPRIHTIPTLYCFLNFTSHHDY